MKNLEYVLNMKKALIWLHRWLGLGMPQQRQAPRADGQKQRQAASQDAGAGGVDGAGPGGGERGGVHVGGPSKRVGAV